MLYMLALLSASVSPEVRDGLFYKGEAYGPRRLLVCDWFSNFENSRFERCKTADGRVIPMEDGAALQCLPGLCDELDRRARRMAGWTRAEPVWGSFTVRLYGRVSTEPRRKRYLGDATRTVLVEKLVEVHTRRN